MKKLPFTYCLIKFKFTKKTNMKTIAVLTFLLFIVLLSPAQSVKELDTKHGFKEFLLSDDFSKWDDKVIYNRTWNDGAKSYLYKGSLGQQVFDLKVKDIELKFIENKLIGIYITTKPFYPTYEETGSYPDMGLSNYKNLVSKFDALFGSSTSILPERSNPTDLKNIWTGETTLLLVQYDYQGIEKGGRAYVIVLDKNTEDKKLQGGF